MSVQLSFPCEENTPPGFLYIPSFIDSAQEEELLRIIKSLPFSSFEMHGVEAKRKIYHYGLSYNFYSRAVSKTESIPSWLLALKKKSEDVLKKEVAEVLVTHYPVGAGIGWHYDAPAFESLLGVSLLGSCSWQMRKGQVRNWKKFEAELPPRSAYVVQDQARWLWQHHIPPVKSDRYSITFRTLKEKSF